MIVEGSGMCIFKNILYWIYTRVSQKTFFLNFTSFFESLVRMGVQSPQKKFQRYRPINDTVRPF